MPLREQKLNVTKSSKKTEMTARDIDQIIMNQQRKAEMKRQTTPPAIKLSKSLTSEFFEGLELV